VQPDEHGDTLRHAIIQPNVERLVDSFANAHRQPIRDPDSVPYAVGLGKYDEYCERQSHRIANDVTLGEHD